MTLSSLLLATLVGILPTYGTLPTEAHLNYHENQIMGLIHWGPNTFTDQEWGFGNADPKLVTPAKLNPEQWVLAMKAGGITKIVLVCKHHDGFCLWPSKYNRDYSVAIIPAPNTNFDVVRATRDACVKHGLQFGAYLSPWDRHQGSYGTKEYVEYFHNQWKELLENYGPISEIWLDGANGGTGWYGGVNGDEGERRSISKGYYEMSRLLSRVQEKYPLAIAFGGDYSKSSTWCGNERGESPETWWNVRKGFDGKEYWMPSEADTPLRTGWFYHAHEKPKSLKKLVDTYFASVGHGAVLNLGIAPNRDGLVCEDDVKRLKEFGDYVKKFNATDLTSELKTLRKNKLRKNGGEMIIEFASAKKFNCVDLAEEIELGQRVESFTVSVCEKNDDSCIGDHTWREVAKGTTIGARRLVRFDEVEANAVKVELKALATPAMKQIAIRVAPIVKEDGPREFAMHPDQSWEVIAKDNVFTIDCGMPIRINGFDYIPKADGCSHGIIDAYNFEVSSDCKTWTTVKSGEFGNLAANPVRTRVVFEKSATARYVRFTAKHRLTKGEGFCLKELKLFE